MATRRKKSPEPSLSDELDLSDTPLPLLRSLIPTHQDGLEGFQIVDRTILDPRTSVESDASNLSYPSHEPSLLDQLRTGLSQGADINKILNKKKYRKDVTINFSLTSSPGSLNSSANVTLPRERRQANVLTRKKKSNMTMNFTMNDTASSSDNQENESPVLSSNKPVFKKPFAKEMSIRIDDTLDSDSSKNSIHDDSLPTLDTNNRKLPLKSSLRSKAAPDKNISINISLDTSENGDKSMDQASLADGGQSSSFSDEVPNPDDSLPKLDSKPRKTFLRSSQSRAPREKNMTFDISQDSSIDSEKSVEQASVNDVGPSSSSSNNNENDPSRSKVFVLPTIEGISMNSLNDYPVRNNDHAPDTEKEGNKPEFDATFTLATNSSMKSSDKPMRMILDSKEKSFTGSIANNPVPKKCHTFVVEPAKPQESVHLSARLGTTQSEETLMEVDCNFQADSPAPKVSIPNLATPTRGTTVSCRKSVRLLSEETGVDDTSHTSERSFPNSADDETNSVVQLPSTNVRLQPAKYLTDSVNQSTSSKFDEEPSKMEHSNKLKARKPRYSVNFTLSGTASTDSNIASPEILERPERPLLKKKTSKFSIPIRFGDDTVPSTIHVDAQEGSGNVNEDLDYGDSSLIPTPASSSSHGANNTNISSLVILGKHTNPLAKCLRSNKVSIPYRCDDTVIDDGSPNVGATDDQRQVSEAQPPNPDIVDAEANDGDNISILIPSGKCVNPLAKRRLELNKFSIPCKLEDTVIDSELSNNGKTDDDDDDHIVDCAVDANEHPENASTSNTNPEILTEEVGNLEIAAAPDVVSNGTQSSDAVSLGCSLDDMPRSSNDYSSDSFKSSRKIYVHPQETSNVSKGMSPSLEGHPGVAFSPGSDLSSDGLHLELSLDESLQNSDVESSATSIKSKPDTEAKHKYSSLKIDNAEAAKDMIRSKSLHISQDPPVLTIKSPRLLRRSKCGSKNMMVDVGLSGSQGNVSDLSVLLKKTFKSPLKTKLRLNKMSIAFADETNDSSSVSETDTEAFCGHLDNAQKASTPKIRHSTSTIKEAEVQNDFAGEALHSTDPVQDQNDLQIYNDISAKVPAMQEFIQESVSNVVASEISSKSLSLCRSNRHSSNSLINKDSSVSKHRNTSPIAEVHSSPRTQKHCDEPLVRDGTMPEVLAETPDDGKPITKEIGRSNHGLSKSSGKKNETNIECHSDPAAKDSATSDATNILLPLPTNVHNVESGIASDPWSSSQDAELPTSGPHICDDDYVNVGVQMAVTDIRPSIVDDNGKSDGNCPNIDQLRTSIDPPIIVPSNIRNPSPSIGPSPILDDQEPSVFDASHHTIPSVKLVHHPTVVSPKIDIPNEPESVNSPEKRASYHGIDEGKVDDNVSSFPSTTQAVRTTATSLNLHLTTFDTEAGDATNIKSRCSVTHFSPAREAVALRVEQPVPKNSSVANGLNATKDNVNTLGGKHLIKQEVSSVSELQQTVRRSTLASGKPVSVCDAPTFEGKNTDENNLDALISNTLAPKPAPESVEQTAPDEPRNKHEPTPCDSIPKAGPSGLCVKDDQPEPKVLRKSKRKSVSFKPPTENLYHSPPDHGSFLYHDPNADGRTQVDNGNEFSQIQMTTDISEIEPVSGAKRAKRHFSSTPISIPKKPTSPSKIFVKPQSLASTQLTKRQFLVPPVLPVTKRVSIQPVPEIITPLIPDPQGKPGRMAAGGQGSSESGPGSSGSDLSSENLLEISAIPKDVSTSKWGGNAPLFHSTPLHRTKASIKKRRKKSEQPPTVPQSPSPEEQAETRVVNHSVQTSYNLRSISKTSLASGSASEPLSQSASGSLRRSARRNRTPVATAAQTPQSGANEPSGGELGIGSPANRIAIQDNTILSTHIESQSRTRGSRTRSTTGSAFKSYDSHRKMTSRRLFNNADENKSLTDAGYPSEGTESPPPTSVPPTSNDVATTSWQEDGVLSSPAESSIARSYPPSIVHNDENIIVMSGQQPEDDSDNESVISGVSSGSTSSAPVDNGGLMRQSFESQLSSLRYRSKHHSRERAGTHHQAEPVKPRSKFAIKRLVPASDLDVIFPVDVPVRKRKRTRSAAAKLFNPGAKWKKSKQLYAWLKKKLEPEYKLHTNLESERLVLELDRARILVSQGHKQGALDLCIERLVRLKICSNQIQLWGFMMKFMPYDFVREVVPMGGAFGKPFDKNHSFMPYDPIELSS